MNPIQHPSANDVLGAPPGIPHDLVRPLPITRFQFERMGPALCSWWLPTPEELALLNAGKPVRLSIHGHTHPPLYVGVDGDGRLEF